MEELGKNTMGHGEYIADRMKGAELQLSAPLSVIASPEHIEALRSSSGSGWLSDANYIPLGAGEPIPDQELGQSGIVLFEVDPAIPASMDRIRHLHRIRPGMPQIVAMRDVDLKLVRTLVREGVADVVEIPFSAEEILQTVVAVLETHREAVGSEVRLAPLIAVTRAVGGSGATTIASHLAAGLAAGKAHAKVCIFDLDIQFGRMAEVLGLTPRRTLSDLLDAGGRIDSALLHTVAQSHHDGLDLIAAPAEIVPIEAVRAEDLARVIDLARKEYDFVVLDLPASLTNWSLSVLAGASSIVMVVEQSLASLRQARRRLDLFRNLGLDHRRVSIVVNRTEKKLFSSINMGDVEEALGRPVLAGVSADPATLCAAQDRGILADAVRRKSPFVSDMEKLSDLIAATVAEDVR
ncbi:AAA family ATPase [Erythrobacter mangrovi]|uniref:AAA family ATPase n=1 Tax=Erythrobacter mangrovi TaxID=2739433 RepID=A0A7D4CCW6_9SPHN|nr:AAA family ATPase [Erythrobacter mangrovi]QKG71129.1 AAA family ATPase [Erythrobacter mangrovi]